MQVAPGGQNQYVNAANHGKLMMLPTDVSLTFDPLYKDLVTQFANNLTLLTQVFGEAWYKLTTRDMGKKETQIQKDVH
jgi:catalase (peroxidase I)